MPKEPKRLYYVRGTDNLWGVEPGRPSRTTSGAWSLVYGRVHDGVLEWRGMYSTFRGSTRSFLCVPDCRLTTAGAVIIELHSRTVSVAPKRLAMPDEVLSMSSAVDQLYMETCGVLPAPSLAPRTDIDRGVLVVRPIAAAPVPVAQADPSRYAEQPLRSIRGPEQ